MEFFLDSCILLKCIESGGESNIRTFHRLAGSGHSLKTSITVIGESIHQSILKDFDAHGLIDLLVDLDLEVIYPCEELRPICSKMDATVHNEGLYGSSATDRTHFAYAITSKSDFFITSPGETRGLKMPKDLESDTLTRAVTMQWIKETIL
jgi:hypothetical protein